MIQTRAEATAFEETSLHQHVMEFIYCLEGLGDPRLYVTRFGVSPQGRELPLLVLSGAGVRTPAEARTWGRPVVLVISGIHAGEVEGKEACLMLCRDILAGKHGDLLDKVVLVVVPLFNPDGNDATDPGNRRLDLPKLSGQIGPALVGTRVNASGVNLNRDYLLQSAPEMRLLQERVFLPWAPDLCIDNHATNGSVHRFFMTVDVPHTGESGRGEPVRYMRETMVPEVFRRLKERHGLDAGWYGNFVEDERSLDARQDAEPDAPVREGWMTYPHHPRFGANYRGMFSRLDLLLECYSYITFEQRVQTAYAFMLESLIYVGENARAVLELIAACERPRSEVAIRYRLEALPEPVTILTRAPRRLDGEPAEVTLPHMAAFVAEKTVRRPLAYVVPAHLAEHFARHGLRVTEARRGEVDVEIPVVAEPEGSGADGAGDGGTARAILEAPKAAAGGPVAVIWKQERRPLPAGCCMVYTDARQGALACYLCEPESDDGLLQNGLIPVPPPGQEIPIWRLAR